MTAKSTKSADRLSTFDPAGTVFSEFTALAIKHNAVNLGQGFPTFPVPEFITKAATNAVQQHGLLHQYTRSEGHVRLANALSTYFEDKLDRKLDPLREIVTTVGASEAIYSTMQAFINPGDEVILMQPFYDCYMAAVTLAGGVPVMVSLRPPMDGPAVTSDDWKFDVEEIRRAIKPGKTKMIMVNNPHNPIGKVFTRKELEAIAAIAKEFDLLVLADEVYETLVYPDSVSPFIKFASLPGMFERTITVGSIGKMFGVTGWKIGWALGPPEIVRAIWLVHQYIPFTVVTPLQEATAVCLEQTLTNGYFERTIQEYQACRDKLHAALQSVGLTPTLPHGGYFILADTTSIPDPAQTGTDSTLTAEEVADPRRDFRLCKWFTKAVGVTPIPPSAFYHPSDMDTRVSVAGNLARFAFCKSEETLDAADAKLKAYFGKSDA
ncbi:pyridoxal phosphate-dependent transferase [Fimicolochytrium jonesii]|uniref:pyridoxal phosphate-dependent transferase n=1 Tax=Fimicolochytrium jonesii TaxID=1396493 RepID=UPI0022FE915E|nr:pyridoxal phosphate-dependent transferase [Fimicolochytrium jonesii]KAI8817180.1 pyridoxal phosphate-dependent transferase [Fimicolochytrium jonesii]